jgi:hypothetical protein
METAYQIWAQVYFGGHDATGLKNDTWFQKISNADELRADPLYSWELPTITGTPPAQRSDHSAIVGLGNSMIVFGGLGANTVFNDVWRLFYDGNFNPPYRWSPMNIINPTGAPPARYGHSAIYDETVDAGGVLRQRMIVFGGTPVLDQDPTDSRVWELRFNPSSPNDATWSVMTQVPLGSNGSPSPRYWHTMNADNAKRVRTTAPIDTCHAALYPAGYQAVQWDRRDQGGVTVRPSVYLYRLTAGSFRAQKKMVLLP